MNYNAAHFRKEVLVRLTLRASYYEKNLAFGFSATARRFSPKPSLAPSRIPALRLRLHGQAGKPPFMNLPRRLLRAHTFCVPGGRSAPLCTRSKMTAAPALAVSKIAGEKAKTEGILYEKMQSVLSQWTVVFSCCGAESCYRRESLHSGGMVLPWLRLFVSGVFAAEKIKHSCSPAVEKSGRGCNSLRGSFVFQTERPNFDKNEVGSCQPNRSIPLPRPALT